MKKQSTLNKVFHLISKYRIFLFFSIVFSVITVLASLYVPILFGDAIDEIVSTGNVHFDVISSILIKVAIVLAIYGIFTWLMNIINNHVAYHVTNDIRSLAIRKIQTLPLNYLDTHGSGDIVSRMIADADQFSDGLLLGLTQLFSGIFTIIMTLFFMIQKSLLITVLVLVLTPLSFFVAKFIASRSYSMFRKQAEARGEQTVFIEEMIGNEKVIDTFGYGTRASARFHTLNETLQYYSQRAIFYSSLTNPSTRAVNNVIYACVAFAGTFLITKGNLTVGGLTVLLSYANQYMKPFNDISSVVTEFQNALACADRIFDLIETESEIPEQNAILPEVEGNVDINHVNFSYVPQKPLIENFDLHAKKGTHVAIVGPTGAGKSTVINLLMRFYDVDSGNIQIEGVNIDEVTRHSLRQSFGMVLQETWLKNGTIRENIAFGKPDATDEEIIQAAKEAHSWNFIRRLPNKLDEVVSEDSLSAGQKQLLCITRVMLALPPMLILDEATSAIDTRTEQQIQNAFDKLMEGRTSFVVAHRLSTIRNADIILVMNEGKIIEQGTHDELMKKNGFYTNLYTSQFVRTNQ